MEILFLCYAAFGLFLGLSFLDEITPEKIDEITPAVGYVPPGLISAFLTIMFAALIIGWPLFIVFGMIMGDKE